MPRPPVDLARKIKDILRHVQPLPDEAKAPILHYRRTGADIWGALAYIERAVGEGERYQAVVDRHLGRLYGMALVNLVETFERFLKEVAAECVDCLADFVVDDRFNVLGVTQLTDKRPEAHGDMGALGEWRRLIERPRWAD